jgi:hypothetical protein
MADIQAAENNVHMPLYSGFRDIQRFANLAIAMALYDQG